MSPVLWVLLGIVVFVLLPAFLIDLRARSRGHRLRDSGSMWADVRDTRRDTRAGQQAGWFGRDIRWTAFARRHRRDRRDRRDR
ncbi:hypothetical protein B0I33_110148 [Prauserella shujinwangii]|uniref:Uncharacterized protein n=1 Tax=Prauserella shujinwangii TaxID=1453103 RepID=A0A2T0LP76_9PSEU|nr:hypothetical protein [Prauserella shujinwangii]PRX45049.1 hypothetical protein B0I33_110148 [Prauserella shujinwangii]